MKIFNKKKHLICFSVLVLSSQSGAFSIEESILARYQWIRKAPAGKSSPTTSDVMNRL